MQKNIFNKYTATGITDVGCVRKHNEDTYLIDKKLGLLLVADGMGGHEAGEVASKESIRIILQMLRMQQPVEENKSWFYRLLRLFQHDDVDTHEEEDHLEKALFEANNYIFQLNMERGAPSGTGMGTTLAGCWIVRPDLMLVFHIGDSRVYRLRNGELKLITKDHSVLQDWHDNGKIGEQPKSNVINRAVGPYQTVTPEIQVIDIQNTDSFLICSDGLSDMVDDQEIEKQLEGLNARQIDNCSHKLLISALALGGNDNITIVLLTHD